MIGDKPLSQATYNDYRSRLRVHLLPFFGDRRLDEIDRDLCLAFKAHKLREAQELREAIAAGAVIRDRRGRRRDPTGPSMLKKLVTALAAILDEAVEDGHITTNPARSRRMRVHVPKPKRSFLEIDELAALEDAAATQDAESDLPADVQTDSGRPGNRATVAALYARGMPPKAIAAELDLAKSTVSHHLARLGAMPAPYIGRRAIVKTLGRSGVRVSELCDLRIGQIRLHAPDGAHFHITDSKTEAGIRTVQITPTSPRSWSSTSTASAAPASQPAPTPTPSPTPAAPDSPANAPPAPSPPPPDSPPNGNSSTASHRYRTSPRTPSAVPTYRSLCSPTTSTSSGSCTKSVTPTPR